MAVAHKTSVIFQINRCRVHHVMWRVTSIVAALMLMFVMSGCRDPARDAATSEAQHIVDLLTIALENKAPAEDAWARLSKMKSSDINTEALRSSCVDFHRVFAESEAITQRVQMMTKKTHLSERQLEEAKTVLAHSKAIHQRATSLSKTCFDRHQKMAQRLRHERGR